MISFAEFLKCVKFKTLIHYVQITSQLNLYIVLFWVEWGVSIKSGRRELMI